MGPSGDMSLSAVMWLFLDSLMLSGTQLLWHDSNHIHRLCTPPVSNIIHY